jgi:hypothetical protein
MAAYGIRRTSVTRCTLASAINWSTACGLPSEASTVLDSLRNLTALNQTQSPTPSHQYGQAVVNRVNFAHNRVQLSLDASTGIDLWKKDARALRLAANIENLNNRLNVIDFAGLFSGNAIAPPRSYSVRFQTTF